MTKDVISDRSEVVKARRLEALPTHCWRFNSFTSLSEEAAVQV